MSVKLYTAWLAVHWLKSLAATLSKDVNRHNSNKQICRNHEVAC
jgi:hypothetical protein